MKKIKNIFLTATHLLIGSVCFAQDNLPVSGQIAEHDYVDLGLPSGTLWATYNVGATKPTEYGDYFAWGETEPKEDYSWSTYKWTEDKGKTFTKYVHSEEYGTVDNKMVLEAEDDAATANWGADWRMPTFDEINELTENCEYSWIEVNGIKGAKFTASNGNFVFFPAAGNRYGSEIEYSGQEGYGYYRSSSLHESYDNCAERIYFNEKGFYKKTITRYEGHSVRAVANKTTDIEEYVVSFYTQDSVLIESQKVEKGKSATAVDAPVVDGYEFIGWSDSSFTNVMKDLDIYAQYKAITKDTLPVSGQIAEHDYVDLGLPSGTLWATYNVGATTPEEYGDYFAWGETKPKEDYSWETYKYGVGSGFDVDSITKYNMSEKYGIIDSLSTLLPEDDAATANWGSAWRMPTREEIEELLDGCSWEWVEDFNGSGVNGRLGTSKKNGATIFLPAGGGRLDADLDLVGSDGLCWSSSLNEYGSDYANYLYFGDSSISWYGNYRILGLSVRAVASDNQTNTSNIISNPALKVYAENSTIHVVNAQPNTNIQVFDMSGKAVASGTTDANGNVEISLSTSKGVYVVTDGSQSTKVILK